MAALVIIVDADGTGHVRVVSDKLWRSVCALPRRACTVSAVEQVIAENKLEVLEWYRLRSGDNVVPYPTRKTSIAGVMYFNKES